MCVRERDVRYGARPHLKEELVSEHVDGQLLVAEGVDTGRAAAGRRPDLERDRPHGLPHADEQPDEVLVRRRLGQELLLPHHTAPQPEAGTRQRRQLICSSTTADVMYALTHQAVSDLAPGTEGRAAGRLGLPPRRERPRRVHPHRLAVERCRRPGRLPHVWRQPSSSANLRLLHVCATSCCYFPLTYSSHEI